MVRGILHCKDIARNFAACKRKVSKVETIYKADNPAMLNRLYGRLCLGVTLLNEWPVAKMSVPEYALSIVSTFDRDMRNGSVIEQWQINQVAYCLGTIERAINYWDRRIAQEQTASKVRHYHGTSSVSRAAKRGVPKAAKETVKSGSKKGR